jgi:uncharacterized membrane protein
MAKADTGWAFIGTLPIIGFILAILMKKKDKYVMFYAKQGLALGIAMVAGSIALVILVITIPLLPVWNIVCFILWIISVINAFSGKEKATPIFGKLASKF